MKIELTPDTESESITTHYPAPCSTKMLQQMRELQKIYGRSVNRNLRNCMQEMIDEHEKKLKKAS